jgi:hypothetical protein
MLLKAIATSAIVASANAALLCATDRVFCVYSSKSSESTVSIKVQANQPTVGWLGFGFGKSMAESDSMYIVQPGCVVTKRESNDHEEPREQFLIKSKEVVRPGGFECDFEIERESDGLEDLIWAWGKGDEFGFHDGIYCNIKFNE